MALVYLLLGNDADSGHEAGVWIGALQPAVAERLVFALTEENGEEKRRGRREEERAESDAGGVSVLLWKMAASLLKTWAETCK